MKRIVITLLLLLFCTSQLWSQNRGFTKRKGTTEIVGDIAVKQLVERHIEFNEQVKTIPGYRVQIASMSGAKSRTEAFKKKEQFKADYPDVEVYVVFMEPNFKVLAGDFRSRLDAFVFSQQCKNKYPCTIVKDNVYPSRLNWNNIVPESDDEMSVD